MQRLDDPLLERVRNPEFRRTEIADGEVADVSAAGGQGSHVGGDLQDLRTDERASDLRSARIRWHLGRYDERPSRAGRKITPPISSDPWRPGQAFVRQTELP